MVKFALLALALVGFRLGAIALLHREGIGYRKQQIVRTVGNLTGLG